MATFRIFEVAEESQYIRRLWTVEGDDPDEAMERVQAGEVDESNASPWSSLDDAVVGQSGWAIEEGEEGSTDADWWEAAWAELIAAKLHAQAEGDDAAEPPNFSETMTESPCDVAELRKALELGVSILETVLAHQGKHMLPVDRNTRETYVQNVRKLLARPAVNVTPASQQTPSELLDEHDLALIDNSLRSIIGDLSDIAADSPEHESARCRESAAAYLNVLGKIEQM